MPADADPARTVGFVGIGNMGWPMAANLVRAGFQVAVADTVSGRAARFAAEVGGRACDGAASVAAGADVLVTSLPTSTHVSEVIEQAESALRRGCVVIDMTSGVPTVTRSLAERLAAAGVAMIDAPVSGGVARARPGWWTWPTSSTPVTTGRSAWLTARPNTCPRSPSPSPAWRATIRGCEPNPRARSPDRKSSPRQRTVLDDDGSA